MPWLLAPGSHMGSYGPCGPWPLWALAPGPLAPGPHMGSPIAPGPWARPLGTRVPEPVGVSTSGILDVSKNVPKMTPNGSKNGTNMDPKKQNFGRVQKCPRKSMRET